MAFNFENYVNSLNILKCFGDNLYKEATTETTSETTDDIRFKTSAVSEHHTSIANEVIELNHVRNELLNIETRLMDHDNANRLKTCQLLTEKEANILTSLNGSLLFLHEEVQHIKSALFSFKQEKALLIPKEAQKDFLKTVDILSDFNNNMEKILENKKGTADDNLKSFIEVFEKNLEELKQAMCVLSKTHSEIKSKTFRMNSLTVGL